MAKIDRGKLDDTLAVMFSNVEFRGDYLYYACMLGQCSVKIDRKFGKGKSPAGVAFIIDHYNLYINPDIFDTYNLHGRLAILKHEMLHILFGHVQRTEKLKHKRWNYATDCAINQLINKEHLPKDGVTPETIKTNLGIDVPLMKGSEEYYNLLDIIKEDPKKGESGQEGESDEKRTGTHETWEESNGDPDLQQDITKKMIERAQDETIKGKGNVPSECGDWLEMFSRKCEVQWNQVLRGILGNKKVGTRSTIMKRDRRFPNRPDLRGKVKKRSFGLLVIADVSGSMSDKNVLDTFGEVKHVTDITKTAVDLIQIDTEAYPPEKLTKQTKLVKRKGHGGTELFPGIEMAQLHNIDFQAVIILTDGGLYSGEVKKFSKLKKRIIWLITKDGSINEGMNSGKMKAFQLKV